MIHATCHPDKRHKSKGLCGACYHRQLRKDKKLNLRPRLKLSKMPEPILSSRAKLIMDSWKDKLHDMGTLQTVMEGIFGKNGSLFGQELL